MEEVQTTPAVVEHKCLSCYMTFPVTEAHFKCERKVNEANQCSMIMCGDCFPLFLKGRNRDNKGWIAPTCSRCRGEIPYHTVAKLLGAEFAAYDSAMVRMTLALMHDKVVACPGADCGLVFFRPPTRKEKKRQAMGNASCRTHECSCGTTFCTGCGERWNDAHNGLKCHEFAKWKQTNDPAVLSMAQWVKERGPNMVKACPGCKHLTEKNQGCNNHNCVLCGFNFCWLCLGPYGRCHCARIAEKRNRLKAKKAERKLRKKEAAILAAQLEIIAKGNVTGTLVVAEVVQESVHVSRAWVDLEVTEKITTPPPVVVIRSSNRTRVPEYQDFDVIILNPRKSLLPRPIPSSGAKVDGKGKEELEENRVEENRAVEKTTSKRGWVEVKGRRCKVY